MMGRFNLLILALLFGAAAAQNNTTDTTTADPNDGYSSPCGVGNHCAELEVTLDANFAALSANTTAWWTTAQAITGHQTKTYVPSTNWIEAAFGTEMLYYSNYGNDWNAVEYKLQNCALTNCWWEADMPEAKLISVGDAQTVMKMRFKIPDEPAFDGTPTAAQKAAVRDALMCAVKYYDNATALTATTAVAGETPGSSLLSDYDHTIDAAGDVTKRKGKPPTLAVTNVAFGAVSFTSTNSTAPTTCKTVAEAVAAQTVTPATPAAAASNAQGVAVGAASILAVASVLLL